MKGQVNISFESDVRDPGERKLPLEPISLNGKDIKVEEKARAKWGNSVEFLMSCIAMSVGLGNIWRFPMTAYENGGGAFLIPYIIILIVIGRPLYYLEMVLGQLSSKSNIHMFEHICPAMSGIGYAQVFSVFCVGTYYCSIMALTLFYFFNSFESELPWTKCEPEWSNCIASGTYNNVSNGSSSSELYFSKSVLHAKAHIDDGIGLPDWRLTLCLLAAWAALFLIAVKGVKSSGKVSYFLALFPYVVLIALVIQASTQEGSAEGIWFFIKPRMEKLFDPNVWYAAVTQCFFSLGVGFGQIVMYSSYNDFGHNIHRDAMIVSYLDTITSLLAGFTIFAVLGNLAHELGVDVQDVIKSGGNGLAFISYPEAIAKFKTVPQLFAVLFFFMLFVLGLGSLVALNSVVTTLIKDEFPKLKNWHVTAVTALVGFLFGIVYLTPGGQFILTLVDFAAGSFIVYVVAISEIVVVIWWYGLDNICLDIEFMLKSKVSVYWRVCWSIITPVLLLIILVYSLAVMKPLTYNGVEFPSGVLACGWVLLAIGLCQIPGWILWNMYKNRSLGFPQIISKAFSTESWGPKDPIKKREWLEFKNERKLQREARGETKMWYVINTLLGRTPSQPEIQTERENRF